MSADGHLAPGTEHSDVERAFGGDAPDCKECDTELDVVNSYTFACRNPKCSEHDVEIDAEAFAPDPDAGY